MYRQDNFAGQYILTFSMGEFERQYQPKNDATNEREMPRNFSGIKEMVSENDFQIFFKFIYENFGDQPVVLTTEEKQRAIAIAQKAREKWEKAQGSKVYYGITDMDSGEMAATGFLDIMKARDGEDQGWIKFLAVAPDLRGRGLAQQIKNRIEIMAREKGCSTLNCTVLVNNPLGLDVELKDGFIFTDLFFDKDENWKFFGYKRLDNIEDADKKNGPLGHMQEVKLSETETLKRLVDQSAEDQWAVIDIKNLGDNKNNNPENWALILEKIS